jgi:uncharacterized protein YcgI (DUF1989 family)
MRTDFNNPNSNRLIDEIILNPHSGTSLKIQSRQLLRIIDIAGSQVVDLVSFSQLQPRQYLSSPRSMDINSSIYFSSGDRLLSEQNEIMWTIMEDKVGKHCFLFAPCDQKMFELTYDVKEPHPNCLDNLSASLSGFGIHRQQIFVPFNIFMHASIQESGEIEIKPPLSKPGDFIDLRAEMDLIVGVSACSAYKANDFSFSPIKLEIYSNSGE